jgi:hypothetical protein
MTSTNLQHLKNDKLEDYLEQYEKCLSNNKNLILSNNEMIHEKEFQNYENTKIITNNAKEHFLKESSLHERNQQL